MFVPARAPYPLEVSFDLFETAIQMRAQRHRREHPDAVEAEVSAVVRAWVGHRPIAPFGDGDGIGGAATSRAVTEVETQLRRIGGYLARAAHAFALVGDFALSARSEPRLTRVVDLAVAVANDRDAESLVVRLGRDGYTVIRSIEEQSTGRLATVRVASGSESGMVIDLLFESCGIEQEIAAAADEIEVLPGLVLPVATVGHLIAMKLLSRDDRRRPLDADDLRALSEVATEQDWKLASEAVAQITLRGYARGRDLADALARLRANGAY